MLDTRVRHAICTMLKTEKTRHRLKISPRKTNIYPYTYGQTCKESRVVAYVERGRFTDAARTQAEKKEGKMLSRTMEEGKKKRTEEELGTDKKTKKRTSGELAKSSLCFSVHASPHTQTRVDTHMIYVYVYVWRTYIQACRERDTRVETRVRGGVCGTLKDLLVASERVWNKCIRTVRERERERRSSESRDGS